MTRGKNQPTPQHGKMSFTYLSQSRPVSYIPGNMSTNEINTSVKAETRVSSFMTRTQYL